MHQDDPANSRKHVKVDPPPSALTKPRPELKKQPKKKFAPPG